MLIRHIIKPKYSIALEKNRDVWGLGLSARYIFHG